jgi:hypothetical protein
MNLSTLVLLLSFVLAAVAVPSETDSNLRGTSYDSLIMGKQPTPLYPRNFDLSPAAPGANAIPLFSLTGPGLVFHRTVTMYNLAQLAPATGGYAVSRPATSGDATSAITANVLDFGAKCKNASFDDGPGIQAAILSVDSKGGGTVSFPPGATCYVNSFKDAARSRSLVWFSSGDVNGWISRNLILQGNGATLVSKVDNSVLLGNAPEDKTGINQACTLNGCGTLENIAVYGISPVKKGDSSIRLDKPGDAVRFHVGDAVFIRGGVGAGTPDHPMTNIPNAELNEVSAINAASGTLALKWPASKAYPNGYDPRRGKMPLGIVDIAPYTSTNLVIENLKFKTVAYPLSVFQTIGVTFRNVEWEISGIGMFTNGSNRAILFDNVTAVDSNPCKGAGIYQIARNTVDLEIRNSSFTSGNPECALLNVSEGSANIRIHNSKLTGKGTIAGGAFMDFSLIDNDIDINSGTALATTCCGATAYNIVIQGNRINSPGRGPLYIGKTAAPGIDGYPGFIFSGNIVTSGSTTSAVVLGAGPGTATGNNITVSSPTANCIEIAAPKTLSAHAITLSRNICTGTVASSGSGVVVRDDGVQTKGPFIENNQFHNFARDLLVVSPLHETGMAASGNVLTRDAAPRH